ncbi:MAG: DUF6125 family protein [Phycisphaerae bacterium]|jgi:hypothetical protein
MDDLQSLSRDELIKLIRVHAKNWLAHDGCWFLAAEEKYGLDAAIELDTRACGAFSRVEARRIMEAFKIPAAGGLDALESALRLRLYATVNPQRIERPDNGTLHFKMLSCRVQTARRRKALSDFPCKPVGTVEYTEFAETIDPRIKTRCLQCPPDPTDDTGFVCGWEFTL